MFSVYLLSLFGINYSNMRAFVQTNFFVHYVLAGHLLVSSVFSYFGIKPRCSVKLSAFIVPIYLNWGIWMNIFLYVELLSCLLDARIVGHCCFTKKSVRLVKGIETYIMLTSADILSFELFSPIKLSCFLLCSSICFRHKKFRHGAFSTRYAMNLRFHLSHCILKLDIIAERLTLCKL